MTNFNDMSWLNGIISPSGLPIAPTGNFLSGPGMPTTQNSWNGAQFIMPQASQPTGGGNSGGILAAPPGTAMYQAPQQPVTTQPQGRNNMYGQWGSGRSGNGWQTQPTTNYQAADPSSWLSIMSALTKTGQ